MLQRSPRRPWWPLLAVVFLASATTAQDALNEVLETLKGLADKHGADQGFADAAEILGSIKGRRPPRSKDDRAGKQRGEEEPGAEEGLQEPKKERAEETKAGDAPGPSPAEERQQRRAEREKRREELMEALKDLRGAFGKMEDQASGIFGSDDSTASGDESTSESEKEQPRGEEGANSGPGSSSGKEEKSRKPPFEDPFADILKDFQTGTEELKADRDRKKEEYKAAEAELKDAKKEVLDLERQLREAQAKVRTLEMDVKRKKAAKLAAEKLVLESYSRIASNVERTARRAMGERGSEKPEEEQEEAEGEEDPAMWNVKPEKDATAVLWGSNDFTGELHVLKCCGYYDLSRVRRPTTVRSIRLSEGLRAVLYPGAARLAAFKDFDLRGADAKGVELFGSLRKVDEVLPFTQSCCDAIQLLPGVQHDRDSSVLLYEKAEFEGPAFKVFLPGDYDLDKPMRVGSVRVPVGLKATFYSSRKFKEGSYINTYKQDTGSFPEEDSNPRNERQPRLWVLSVKVRQVKDEDLHGLLVYPQPYHQGRPQFFEAGLNFVYPETWPPIQSLRLTNRTFARFFLNESMVTVRADIQAVKPSEQQPETLEVAAICDPPDFCGDFGKCTAPQRCECAGGYSGERCHLQHPDETSAVLCERNSVVVRETLPCSLILRRHNQACNATSLFLKLRLAPEVSGTMFGSPLVVERGHIGSAPQEKSIFAFDAVFDRTGKFDKAFEFLIFNKHQEGAFAPRIEVLERCDGPEVQAKVSCERRLRAGPLLCNASLHGPDRQALRCPRQAVQISLLGSYSPVEYVEDGSPSGERFQFRVHPAQLDGAAAKGGHLRFAVEVRHGPGWLAPTLRREVELKEPVDPATATSRAKDLLRRGEVAAALAALDACLANRPCAALRAAALRQVGRFGEASEAFTALGAGSSTQKAIAEAQAAGDAAQEAIAKGDALEAVRSLEEVLQVSPLSPHFHWLLANASLEVGDFERGLEEARLAQRLERTTGGHSSREPGAGLAILGRALLALGQGEAARQNLYGCAQLEGELTGTDSFGFCQSLSSKAARLEQEASALALLLQAESWKDVLQAAEKLLLDHEALWGATLRFRNTTWGLEGTASVCAAHHALNSTDASTLLRTCRAVLAAPQAMKARLDASLILRCQVAEAEALESLSDLEEALAAAEAAESMLGSISIDDLVATVRLLRERLHRARQQEEKQKSEGGENNQTRKPKREEPTDLYAVLGVDRNATASEIKRAYRQLALKYHPDKNSDPEAVQIFLDIQKAYQILSDEILRKKYDAGQKDVMEEADQPNLKPMKFRILERDRERGIAKVWWYDPNTGEEGIFEMEIEPEREGGPAAARPLPEHCCLPGREAADSSEEL